MSEVEGSLAAKKRSDHARNKTVGQLTQAVVFSERAGDFNAWASFRNN
jgi:hypothetical protein